MPEEHAAHSGEEKAPSTLPAPTQALRTGQGEESEDELSDRRTVLDVEVAARLGPKEHEYPPISQNEQNEQPELSTGQMIILAMLTTLAFVMQGSAVIATMVSIRPISTSLNIPAYEVQWLSSSVSVAFACTLLLFGRLADIWGHKFFFVTGLLLSAVFNLACALAKTKIQLFIFRGMTGWTYAW